MSAGPREDVSVNARRSTFSPPFRGPAPPRRSTVSSPLHTPSPTGSPVPQFSSNARAHAPLPRFTSPRTDDAEVQRAIDDITERVNELNARGNALAQQQRGPQWFGHAWRGPEGYAGFSPANGGRAQHPGYTNVDGYPLPDPAVYIPPREEDRSRVSVQGGPPVGVGYHPSRGEDKENPDMEVDPVVLRSEHQTQGNGGLGLGWVGRELGNTIHVDNAKGKEKEKKAKRECTSVRARVGRLMTFFLPNFQHLHSLSIANAR
jgi:hypothetical protein